jgi:site-specific DNA recombinase
VIGRGRIETDTATGFLMTGVEVLMAEHFRRLIAEKTRDAMARLRAKGRRTSRWPPFGYAHQPDGRLVEIPGEQDILRRIDALRASGLSLRGLSGALAAEGIMARNSRPFAAQTLSRLVTNRTVGYRTELL